MCFIMLNSLVISLLLFLFFIFSKLFEWDHDSKSVFECGFTSFFYSRFSFSIHYFLVALVFLFFDLELCFLIPFFSGESTNLFFKWFFLFFSGILTLGLLIEWSVGLLDWKF